MADIISKPLLSKPLLSKRAGTSLALAAVTISLLAGCSGGGGGNGSFGSTGGAGTNSGTGNTGSAGNTGNNNGGLIANASIIGKVVDTQGNGVPGVNINTDSGGTTTLTLSQGGYRLDNLTGNVVHLVTAAVTLQNNVTYTGSTQVFPQSNLLTSNANIVLSPSSRQATVGGIVYGSDGLTPLNGVRVFLSVPNNANYSSLVAFTDTNGKYSISNIPVDLPSNGQITITASTANAQNQSYTLTGLQASGAYSQNFRLNASNQLPVNTPAIVSIVAATEPSSPLTGSARIGAHADPATGSLYDHLRRLISPAYASVADRHSASGTRLIAHAVGAYAIETDIAFSNAAQTGSVLGYYVYRASGAALPKETDTQYDFLTDPLANFYTDLTFAGASGSYTPYGQYSFALSALNTSNVQTALSTVYSVSPLGPLTLIQPTTGQGLANDVTLTWNLVVGATSYYVFIYDQFPTAAITPVFGVPQSTGGTALAGTVNTYTLPGPLQSGSTYYAVIVGAADQTEATDPVTNKPVVIPNAVLTFSPITRFYVQ